MKQPTHVCRNCLSQVRPVKYTPGSFAIELILWCALLLPGIIYSVWRIASRKWICPACGSDKLVPFGTPAAALLSADSGIEAPTPTALGASYHLGRSVGSIFRR